MAIKNHVKRKGKWVKLSPQILRWRKRLQKLRKTNVLPSIPSS